MLTQIMFILRELVILSAVGLVFGAALANARASGASSLLFDLSPHDPMILRLRGMSDVLHAPIHRAARTSAARVI